MQRMILLIAVAAALAVSYEAGRRHPEQASSGKTARRVLYYVDPMHPSYRSTHPGVAPDCGMQLEPVFADEVALHGIPPAAANIDLNTQRLLGIRVAAVERNGSTRELRAAGRVAPEDTRVYKLNPGVDGYVRDTYNDSAGVSVKKDQKLASYFSPDFLAAASGYLAAVERVPGAVGNDGSRTVPFPGAVSKQGVSSLQGYADRLRNLGMSDVQIQRISQNHQLPEVIDVVAPVDGFILARNITPGQHFERNMEFYRIADLSRVWITAEVYEQDALYFRPGTMARITLRDQGRHLAARVSDSLPQTETAGGIVKIRLEAENPGSLLRPEMLVDVVLPVHERPAITVPLDAVIDSGDRARVYVERAEGVFEPREVETGWRFGDRVEIRKGVQAGERIVVAATFLVDSESRLRSPLNIPTPLRKVPRPHDIAAAGPSTTHPGTGGD